MTACVILYRTNGHQVEAVQTEAGEISEFADFDVAYADGTPIFASGQATYQIVELDGTTGAAAMNIFGRTAIERLSIAMREFHIDNNAHREEPYSSPTLWWVIDGRTAEYDVNWPGGLIAECGSVEEARMALARACLEFAVGDGK